MIFGRLTSRSSRPEPNPNRNLKAVQKGIKCLLRDCVSNAYESTE